MKVCAVIGRPGTGKTTLLRAFMQTIDDWVPFGDSRTLVKGHWSHAFGCYVLGTYEDGEVFAGTDRLSMAVQPAATGFLSMLQGGTSAVLFEGDRLGNTSFLEQCAALGNLSILELTAGNAVLAKRYMQRGSRQSDAFLRGRATKISNIVKQPSLGHLVTTVDHITADDTEWLMRHIQEHLA